MTPASPRAGSPGPKTARACGEPFQAGGFVQFAVGIKQLTSPDGALRIGMISSAVQGDAPWKADQNFGQAFFVTRTGQLYNGPQMIYDSHVPIAQGDSVSIVVDGDMMYVSINGKEMPASLGPISAPMYPSVQLSAINDRLSLDQRSEQKTGITPKEQRTMQDSQADTNAIVSSLFAGLQQKHPGQQAWESSWDKQQPARAALGSSSSRVQGATTDYSSAETRTSSPAEYAAVPKPLAKPATPPMAPASPVPTAADGGWEMVVAESGKVYYWNRQTDEVCWERPPDFVSKATSLRLSKLDPT